MSQRQAMHRVCLCLPRKLAELGEAVVSKCSDAASQRVKFTQCDVDDPDLVSNLKQSDILLASPVAIHKNLAYLTNIKWAHSYWAGVDDLIKGSPSSSFLLTRHAGMSYGQLISEYIVAQVVNWERQMYGFHSDQLNSQWNQQRRMAVTHPRMLSTLTIGILGVGTIGKRVAEVCKTFGMRVWGLTRTKSSSPSPHVDQYRLMDGLQELLGECDYVCSILPSTPQTRGLLNGDILSSCAKKKSVLINVGRGDLVSEQTIVKAIEEGWLGGAILDVFEEEPLPADSKLWRMPQVIITPHTAALANVDDIADVFLENLELYMQGKEPNHIVDWSRGY